MILIRNLVSTLISSSVVILRPWSFDNTFENSVGLVAVSGIRVSLRQSFIV